MRILYATESGIAVPYLTNLLNKLRDSGAITLREFKWQRLGVAGKSPDTSQYDIFIYQVLRDLDTTVQDEFFLKSQCRRVLFDSQDSGTGDRYPQFAGMNIPRIKNCPHVSVMASQNVVFATTFPTRSIKNKLHKQSIDISFRVRDRPGSMWGDIRRRIRRLLKKYPRGKKDLEYGRDLYYPDYLQKVRISVNAPGNGEACIRHLLTLQAGSCMLAHESINGIRLLPTRDLVDGVEYVSFNEKNLYSKLDRLMGDRDYRESIAARGRQAFKACSQDAAAGELHKVLKRIVRKGR